MPFLRRGTSSPPLRSLSEEAKRRVALGDSESFFYIVPNRIAQRRMERELVEAANGRAIAKPNVLTLADFAGELCSVAFPTLRLLSDAECAILIEQAIRTLIQGDRLHYFERARDDDSGPTISYNFPIPRGTFELVVNTIRQLKETGVTVADIEHDLIRARDAGGETTEVRRAADIMLIYKEYMRVLEEKSMMDTYGQTLLLNARYAESSSPQRATELATSDFRVCFANVFEGFLDGFYRLEPPSIELLSTLSSVPNLAWTVYLDSREDNPNLFGEVLKLQLALKERGFSELGEVSRRRDSPQDVDAYRAWLRRHLFAAEEDGREKLNMPAVKLWSARDAVEEVEEIARKIKLICDKHPEVRADLSQIVVAAPSMETYTPLFQEAFRRNGIPVQVADRYHLDRSPLVLALLALFDIARFGLRRREVIRVLSSSYFDFQHSSGDKLDAENILYVLAHFKPTGDLRGWKRSLSAQLSKLQLQKEESEDAAEFDRLDANEIRIRRVLLDLDHLSKIIRPLEGNLTPTQFCNTVRGLIENLLVRRRLLSRSSLTIAAGTLEIDVRAFQALMKLLDDLESLFTMVGEEGSKRPLSFYVERFKAASIWVRYSTRPHHGAVLVTSLAQSIAQPAEYLFVAGLTEGDLPAVYQPQVFLMGAMQKGERRQLLEDRVLFYQSITNFSRQLFLCWPEHSLNGSDLSRSIFLDALEDIVEMEREEPVNGIYSYRDLYLKSAEIGSQLFASERSPLPFYVRTLQEFVPRALASQSSRGGEGTPIYRGTVEPLLLTEQERAVLEKNQSCVWSVTQLEMYANCPFKYFSRYVLALGEPSEDEDGLDARERGSVLHEVLREFLTSRRERKLPAIQDLSEAELPEVYEDARKIANRRMDMVASDHPFWKLDAERLLPKKKEGSVLWKFIARERALAPFHPRPEFFEVSFGGAGGKTGRVTERDDRLSRDEPVVIGGVAFRGQIDRIDVSDETFTIVDYKSGARTPTRAEIDRGLSLQLPLYLRVAEDLLRSHLPELTGVAALYHKVLEPESERKLGLAVRSYIQKSFEAVGGKKSGGYVETEEDLQNVIEATIAKARAYVEGISRGEFRLTQRDLVRNCEYCPYGAVCRVQEAIELDSLTKENA